jgi:hypothetical protein
MACTAAGGGRMWCAAWLTPRAKVRQRRADSSTDDDGVSV